MGSSSAFLALRPTVNARHGNSRVAPRAIHISNFQRQICEQQQSYAVLANTNIFTKMDEPIYRAAIYSISTRVRLLRCKALCTNRQITFAFGYAIFHLADVKYLMHLSDVAENLDLLNVGPIRFFPPKLFEEFVRFILLIFCFCSLQAIRRRQDFLWSHKTPSQRSWRLATLRTSNAKLQAHQHRKSTGSKTWSGWIWQIRDTNWLMVSVSFVVQFIIRTLLISGAKHYQSRWLFFCYFHHQTILIL